MTVVPATSVAIPSTGVVRSLALPPHIAAVTPTDRDGDGDNDLGTVVDTFA
jgi:hypothetical protein